MKKKNIFYITNDLYYTICEIKNRIIHIPCEELKFKQRYILNAIKWVYPYKTDIYNVAKIHSGKKWILKLDIKDFYNSVPFCKIQKVIDSVCEKTNQPENKLRFLLLATVNGKLPTGVSTSAHIANACFKPVDKEIQALCVCNNVDYSRYVDDLIFSSYCKENLKFVENKIKKILEFEGYRLNNKKTKYISANKQQNILGLVVNDYKVRLPKTLKKDIRAMLHNYAVFNSSAFCTDTKFLALNKKKEERFAGYIAYIKHIDKVFYNRLLTYVDKLSKKYFIVFPFFK